MKWRNRIVATFLLITMLVMEGTNATTVWAEQTEAEIQLGTGLKVEYMEPVELTEEPMAPYSIASYSDEEYAYWTQYTNDYYYSQLTDSEKLVWDELESACIDYLYSDSTAQTIDVVENPISIDSAYEAEYAMNLRNLAWIFKLANPQYYFLENRVGCGARSIGETTYYYPRIYVYEKFWDAEERATATAQFTETLDSWVAEVKEASAVTVGDRELAAHDLLCNNIVYNFNDYDQSAYSAVCLGETVCAGYAACMQLLLNAVGIETIEVTSVDHAWNMVNIHGYWYNVDATWADQNTWIFYDYYNESTVKYATETSHVTEEFWAEYLPNAENNSAAVAYFVDGDYTYFKININHESGDYLAGAVIASNGALFANIPATATETATSWVYNTVALEEDTLDGNTGGGSNEEPEYTYELTYTELEDGTLEITGFTGEASGDLVIPEMIDGKIVTSIGEMAFYDAIGFTGILSLPAGLKNLGGSAFHGCKNLTGNLTLPEGLTQIPGGAFTFCAGFDGELYIPDSVTYIGNGAFTQCMNLSGTLELPENLTYIGAGAFTWCMSFTGDIYLPDSIIEIGENAFGYNNTVAFHISEENEYYQTPDGVLYTKDGSRLLAYPRLAETQIPFLPTVTKFGSDCCYKCENISGELVFADGVTYFGDNAFTNTNITSVTLPITVESLGYNAFTGYNLTSLHFAGTEERWLEISGGEEQQPALYRTANITFGNEATPTEEGIEFIYDILEDGTLKITGYIGESTGDLIIPDKIEGRKVTAIFEAFINSTGFTGKLVLPKYLKSVGSMSFYGCNNLTGEVVFPDTVETIGNWAFMECAGITEIAIPKSVKEIGKNAFSNCDNLTDVYYAGSESEWTAIITGKETGLETLTIHFNDDEAGELDDIIDAIVNATTGATVTAELPVDDTNLPADVLEAAKEKDIELELSLLNGIVWNINGADIADSNVGNVDLSVEQTTLTNGNIAEATITSLAGNRTAEQLAFGQAGDFPFTGELTLNALSTATGNKVVLVQMVNGELKLSDSAMLSDGGMTFEVSKGTDSAIVYGVNGDCDGNAKVNMKDLMQILHSVSNRTAINEVQKGFVDINMNNKVEMTDLMRELHYISGRNDEL